MEETKKIKVKFSTAICIILIILLAIGCGLLYYFGFVQKDKQIEKIEADKKQIETKNAELEKQIIVVEKEEEIENKEKEVIETTKLNEVPTSDLSVVVLDSPVFFYGYIENGKLNYYMKDLSTSNNANEQTGFNPVYQKNEIKQLNELNNIKRMKVFNPGTGVDPTIYLITEDGEIYNIRLYDSVTSNQIYLTHNDKFKEYKVENVIESEYGHDKLLLKDGTIKTIENEIP